MSNNNPLIPFWNGFVDELNLSEIDLRELDGSSWDSDTPSSSAERTRCRMWRLLISQRNMSGLTHCRYCGHDNIVLCEISPSGEEVPRIAISRGDRMGDSAEELRQLCCMATPLKVLLVCAEWSNDPGHWAHGGEKDALLNEWKKILSAHNNLAPQQHIVGVLVGEIRGNTFRVYSLALGASGEVVQAEKLLIQRKLKWGAQNDA